MHPHLSQKVRKFFRSIFTYEADYRPCSYTVLNEPWITAHFDDEEENPSEYTEVYDSSGAIRKISKGPKVKKDMTDKERFMQLLGVKEKKKPTPQIL